MLFVCKATVAGFLLEKRSSEYEDPNWVDNNIGSRTYSGKTLIEVNRDHSKFHSNTGDGCEGKQQEADRQVAS